MIYKYRSLLKLNISRQLYKPYMHRQLYKPINNLFNSFYELKEVIIDKQKLLKLGKKITYECFKGFVKIICFFGHIIYCYWMSYCVCFVIIFFLDKYKIIKLPNCEKIAICENCWQIYCENCQQIYDVQQK